MNDLLQKIKPLYEKLGMGKVSYERKGIHPSKDWRIMLTTTFVVICFLAFFAFYFYLKIDKGEIFVVTREGAGKDAEISEILLKKVVLEIKNKEEFLRKLKEGNLVPSDPSV